MYTPNQLLPQPYHLRNITRHYQHRRYSDFVAFVVFFFKRFVDTVSHTAAHLEELAGNRVLRQIDHPVQDAFVFLLVVQRGELGGIVPLEQPPRRVPRQSRLVHVLLLERRDYFSLLQPGEVEVLHALK